MSAAKSSAAPGVQLLPASSEYALRAMTCLAHAPTGEWVPRERLVTRAHLPGAYASKILRRLVVAGLVHGQRGWNGGFRLARDAGSITLLDVTTAVDGPPVLDHCAFGYPRCDAAHPCPLHEVRLELQRSFLEWARGTTLAQLPDCVPEPADSVTGARATPRSRSA